MLKCTVRPSGSEEHDAYFRVLAATRAMYRCLVPSCDVLSVDADARLQHLVHAHQYPPSFVFATAAAGRGAGSCAVPLCVSTRSSPQQVETVDSDACLYGYGCDEDADCYDDLGELVSRIAL
jgi:hypothetical protein